MEIKHITHIKFNMLPHKILLIVNFLPRTCRVVFVRSWNFYGVSQSCVTDGFLMHELLTQLRCILRIDQLFDQFSFSVNHDQHLFSSFFTCLAFVERKLSQTQDVCLSYDFCLKLSFQIQHPKSLYNGQTLNSSSNTIYYREEYFFLLLYQIL